MNFVDESAVPSLPEEGKYISLETIYVSKYPFIYVVVIFFFESHFFFSSQTKPQLYISPLKKRKRKTVKRTKGSPSFSFPSLLLISFIPSHFFPSRLSTSYTIAGMRYRWNEDDEALRAKGMI